MAKASTDDYYALLGVDPACSDEDVRRAWRKLALEWHPDRAGPDATAMFQSISIAYGVLADPDGRAAYDRRRGLSRRRAAVATPVPEEPIRRAPGVLLHRLCGPLSTLVTCGIARFVDGGVIELFVAPDELAEGGMVSISMWVRVRCVACTDATAASCQPCGGQRTVEDLFSAWLALRPGVADGTILHPSARLPGMMRPVSFRVRHA